MTRLFTTLSCLALAATSFGQTPCENGVADGYPCSGLDLLSVRTVQELGGGQNGNDCWGWVDPDSNREFVLFGRSNGLSIVEVTDPVNPVYLANVPTATVQSLWRDVKVHDDHAFIVSEAAGHGIQILDLTQIPDITAGPVELEPTGAYLGFGNAHNIVMNEASGYAYGVGTNTAGGGLHAVDVSDPNNPVAAGTYDGAYTHDAQVVMYDGPDADYAGKEIAFCFNGGGGVAIVDVSDKTDMSLVSSFGYANSAYTHQGWLSEDHATVYFNDELDEMNFGNGTRTYIADVSDLDNPVVMGFYESLNTAIDHNMYVRGDKIYASNYLSGLRVSKIGPDGNITPLAYFDTNPESDAPSFDGTWSNYPYFPSGNIAISGFTHLFMVADPNYVPTEVAEVPVELPENLSVHPNPAQGWVTLSGMPSANRVRVLNAVGQEVRAWGRVPGLQGLTLDLAGLGEGMFLVQAESEGGQVRTARVLLQD